MKYANIINHDHPLELGRPHLETISCEAFKGSKLGEEIHHAFTVRIGSIASDLSLINQDKFGPVLEHPAEQHFHPSPG